MFEKDFSYSFYPFYYQTLIFVSFPVIDSLSNLSVRIPEYIQNGQTADLTCSFNLGGDKLYSVKWYKGRHEFYRYMPGQEPVIKTFPVKGMEINVSAKKISRWFLFFAFIASRGFSAVREAPFLTVTDIEYLKYRPVEPEQTASWISMKKSFIFRALLAQKDFLMVSITRFCILGQESSSRDIREREIKKERQQKQ